MTLTKEDILSLGFELTHEGAKSADYRLFVGGLEVLRLHHEEMNRWTTIAHFNSANAAIHYSRAFDTVFQGWVKSKEDLVKVLNMVCNFTHPLITYKEELQRLYGEKKSVAQTDNTDKEIDQEIKDVRDKLGYK